jgi:hypothetical protein
MKTFAKNLLVLVGLLGALLACKNLMGGKSYPDGEAGLTQLATDLSSAEGEDAEKLGKNLGLEDPGKFFSATFGAELGPQLASEYATDVPKLPTIHMFFKAGKAKGRTQILVEKHVSADDENANGLQEAAIKAMKTPMPIYTINVVEPGKTIGSSLWSFAYVDGSFRYLGKMKATKPGASALDELSKKDLKDALSGD